MLEYLAKIGLVALLAAFGLLLLYKWKAIEWLQTRRSKLIHELASCQFCLSFWMGLIISAGYAVATGQYECFLIPLFSTPITRLLL